MAEVGTRDIERWLQDHDTDEVSEAPPIQNQWYTVFDAEDVRLIFCMILQTNDEAAVKTIEVRWTIDGNVYLVTEITANNQIRWVYRRFTPSGVGTAGLSSTTDQVNAAWYVDKRGLSFKVEVRMTTAPGTNQTLLCDCVRETQEIT